MSKVTIIVGLILVFCLSVEAGPPAQPKKERYVVYIGGNSWPLGTGSGKVTDAGWVYDAKSVPVSTYFYPGVATGPVTIYLNFSNNLPITIEITILDQNIKWSPVPASSKIR